VIGQRRRWRVAPYSGVTVKLNFGKVANRQLIK
jgi:hypothetical protein